MSFRHFIAVALAALSLNVFAAVDVNKASQAELESVKGIGPGLSGKILDARKSGEFKNWSDFVDRVSGIGPGNAGRFSQAGLTVAGQGYEGSGDKAPKAERGTKVAKADKAEKSDKADKPARASRKHAETMQ